MTLEEFQELRARQQELLDEMQKLVSRDDFDLNFDRDTVTNTFVNRYFNIQKELEEYDLSDIPFDAWHGMTILGDKNHIVDFSKTHANLDFSQIEISPLSNEDDFEGRFQGCTIRNLKEFRYNTLPDFFDQKQIDENPDIFLSDQFSEKWKEKYYQSKLDFEDLITLPESALQELEKKSLWGRMNENFNYELYGKIGIDSVRLYRYSKEDYEAVLESLHDYDSGFLIAPGTLINKTDLEQWIKASPIEKMKEKCDDYFNKKLFAVDTNANPRYYPEYYVKAHPNIFLQNVTLPPGIQNQYYKKELTLDDVLANIDCFQNVPIEYFMENKSDWIPFVKKFGREQFVELLKEHPDVMHHLDEYDMQRHKRNVSELLKDSSQNAYDALKKYIIRTNSDTKTIPDWAQSLNYKNIANVTSFEEILQIDNKTILWNSDLRMLIENLGLENIKKFDKETQLFSHVFPNGSSNIQFLSLLASFGKQHPNFMSRFRKGLLSYSEFRSLMAECLNSMRTNEMLKNNQSYDFITGKFRYDYPSIFAPNNWIEGLKRAFYENVITLKCLIVHPEYTPYLKNVDLNSVMKYFFDLNNIRDIQIIRKLLKDENGNTLPSNERLIPIYTKKFGNQKIFDLFAKYGELLIGLTIDGTMTTLETEEDYEKAIRDAIYKKVTDSNNKISWRELLQTSPEFVSEHPDLFFDLSTCKTISKPEKARLTEAFYNQSLQYADIRIHPELIPLLKDKNIKVIMAKQFEQTISRETGNQQSTSFKFSDALINAIGNEKYLKLCATYGKYLMGASEYLWNAHLISEDKKITTEKEFSKIEKAIQENLVRECFLGKYPYDVDAPQFLREQYPQLFLPVDAPQILRNKFYNRVKTPSLLFSDFQDHQEWLPYLKNVYLPACLYRNHSLQKQYVDYFETFGDEKGTSLGFSRGETVTQMIRSNQVALMKFWYDKTGQKFIPDFVVMQTFPKEEADKFLSSGKNWSRLMRIKEFSNHQEGRDAMLKLAYAFGVFDNDQRGLKKLESLLKEIPTHLKRDLGHIIQSLDSEEMEDEEYYNLKLIIKQENVPVILEHPLFEQIYRKNADGSYSLTINPQSYPKFTEYVRSKLSKFNDAPIVTAEKAHKLFGGFKFQYDVKFREFLLKNLEEILENPEYSSYISGIQKAFPEMYIVNSNRVLTLPLAVSYIKQNKYMNIEVGNEKVAAISAIAGYSQEDFDTLQEIYQYGRQRVVSSIPKIAGKKENYFYEMLRLDDPLAMAIGTLTDCCQALNEPAEICMEHSMTDPNGRIFVIRDEEGNIVSQSWCWRNQNVLCFDNIEIPDKAFMRATKLKGQTREKFSDEVYDVYKQAARELLDIDDREYAKLLEEGKITQNQYENSKLRKITVGLGYNDIASSIKINAKLETDIPASPLSYQPPVPLHRNLYISDSRTQYVIEGEKDNADVGLTLPIYTDSYIEYTDENFDKTDLLTLEKLETITKPNFQHYKTGQIESQDSTQLVSEIANEYGLDPVTTRIILNPNFALIYDTEGETVNIADILFITKVTHSGVEENISDVVAMQINLALNQIGKEKTIKLQDMQPNQIQMIEKAMAIDSKLDEKRGVSHAR